MSEEETTYIELDESAFRTVMDALEIDVPYDCDACGVKVDKDNFGYISEDFKTCDNFVCIVRAVRQGEEEDE